MGEGLCQTQSSPQGNPIKWSQNTLVLASLQEILFQMTQAGDAPIGALPKQGLQYFSVLSSVTSVRI